MRDATSTLLSAIPVKSFQSTHPMRDATRSRPACDLRRAYFNPRIPCGMRQGSTIARWGLLQFQSTHPMRDATLPITLSTPTMLNFNPRIPCGMRLLDG